MKKIVFSLKKACRRTVRWLKLLLFPPVCRFCGKRQSVFVRTLPQVLCPDCMKGWAQELRVLCPTCAAPYFRCRCMPVSLQRCEARALVKLAAYRADCSPVMSSLVLRAKDVPDRAVMRFLATELMMPTFLAWQELGVAPEDTLVTYAPRSLKNLAIAGHDQARMLSRTLAHALELSWARLFRRIGNKQQKHLNASARAANAGQSFALRKTALVQGKTVLLLDDVCTTGATMSSCARLLYEAGAAHVIAVCAAQTAAASATSRVRPKLRAEE